MDLLNQKICQIKKDYFKNFLNESYIDDSYIFIINLPEEIKRKYSKDPIFKIIPELYKNNHNLEKEILNLKKIKSSEENIEKNREEYTEKNKEYLKMITSFLKEKEEREKEEKEFEKKINITLMKYNKEELFNFFQSINSDIILKEKILNLKSESYKNLLKFEENVINFFIKEVNLKEGYEKVNNSTLNFATRIIGNTITLRFEKEIEVNLIHLLSLIYEVNYYKKWYPYCHISETLNQPGKAKKCVYMIVEIPIIKNRDFLVYGFGINRLRENGTILILCRGINKDSNIFQREFNQKNTNKFVRGDIIIFGFEIKVFDMNHCLVRGLCNIDPKINFIPQSIINMVSKKFAEDMFWKFIKIAQNYEGSEFQNKNPSNIDSEFYKFIYQEVNCILNDKNIENILMQNKKKSDFDIDPNLKI